MIKLLNAKHWLLKKPLFSYNPDTIHLKGEDNINAYKNYIFMKYGREVSSEWEVTNFYNSHSNVEIKLVENNFGPFHMVFFS